MRRTPIAGATAEASPTATAEAAPRARKRITFPLYVMIGAGKPEMTALVAATFDAKNIAAGTPSSPPSTPGTSASPKKHAASCPGDQPCARSAPISLRRSATRRCIEMTATIDAISATMSAMIGVTEREPERMTSRKR